MDNADRIKQFDRCLADMKARRLDREGEWRDVAEYFDPSKTFNITPRTSELHRRRLTSSVPGVARSRCAAIFAGYLVDPTQPFVTANVEGEMFAAGRPTDLDDASRDYLANIEWRVFGRMMNPRSGFLTSTAMVCDELVTYGTAVAWTGRKRGFGPRYQHRPLRSCWVAENDEQEVDTCYYEFTLPLWRVKARFPNAKYVDGWDTDDEGKNRAEVTLVHIVEPRQGGRYGAVGAAKPFAECYVSLEKKAVLEEWGYDSFPFSVPRLQRIAGSVYGRGLCWNVLPEAMALAQLQQMIELGVSLKVLPPTMMPARMFGQPLDRRPGAGNVYDAAGLGFQSAREALQRLDIAGDVGVGVEYAKLLVQNIEQGLLTDWMRLRETGQMTAEEVVERRELRLRSMTAFVPGVDRDLMGVEADRTLEIMGQEGQIPPPPRALAGKDVEWDYAGPLARAQQRQQAQAMGKLFDMTLVASKFDANAPKVLHVTEALRAVAEAYGAPIGALRSRAEVAQMIAADQAKQDAADQAALTNAGATALRDGGQGVLSLTQADNGGALREAA